MKVRDVLILLKSRGWYLSRLKAATASSNTRGRSDELRLLENQATISRLAR
jgi:hypothetical protein